MHTYNTKIKIPETIVYLEKYGGNAVKQLGNASYEIDVTISDSQFEGYWIANSQYPKPLNEVLIRKPKSRKAYPVDHLVLRSKSAVELDQIDSNTKFAWLNNLIESPSMSPEEVVLSWDAKFQFVAEDSSRGAFGMRPPQLGALHAISAHLSLFADKPSTIVLPTGTGKTETLLSAVVYQKFNRVLVIVPSVQLRKQLTKKFLTLGVLPQFGILPTSIPLPRVAELTTGFRNAADVDLLIENANIFIATSAVFSKTDDGLLSRFFNSINHLVFDEAHHVASKSWNDIKGKFSGKNILQFTATPFRTDGKSLDAKIIYNFTMADAQAMGYFKPIRVHTIEEYYEERSDRKIAEKALAVLREDLSEGRDHLMMARVESIDRADEILPIYQEIAADMNPLLVHSYLPKLEQERTIAALISGRSKIVICVKMLGEGFDLPMLKVAALHDHHKSLAISLQFIGRFTRASSGLGDASVVVNVARPAVEKALSGLYAHGAKWDEVLRRLSQDTVERQVQLQELVDSLQEQGDLGEQISLWNLKPGLSAKLYTTTTENWNPTRYTESLKKSVNHWHAISEDEKVLIVLVADDLPIGWGDYKNIFDHVYNLMIVRWDSEKGVLFFYANDYEYFACERIVQNITGDAATLVDSDDIYKIFDNVELPLVRNLGASRIGAISFTQYFGSNVTEGLAAIEKSESSLSNVAVFGYEEGDRTIWGCSQKKGKVWAPLNGTLTQWVDWGDKAWAKISSPANSASNVTENFLRPESITERYSQIAIALQWGEYLLKAGDHTIRIIFDGNSVPLYLVSLSIETFSDSGPIVFSIESDAYKSTFELHIDTSVAEGYRYIQLEGPVVEISRSTRYVKSFQDYMVIDPIVVHYADGGFSYNKYLVRVESEIDLYPVDRLITKEFTNIRKESMSKTRMTDSIQYEYYQEMMDDYDLIFNDDDKGEAADLVALRDNSNGTIGLCLVHCKYSHEDRPGSRVIDFYEVCGQSQRSTRWKHSGIERLTTHLLKRNKVWQSDGYSRFLKGNESLLSYFEKKSRTTAVELEIFLVQPGLSKARASNSVLQLLGGSDLQTTKTAFAPLKVVCSP